MQGIFMVSRREDDLEPPFPDLIQHLEPVLIRHPDVEENQVGFHLMDKTGGLSRIVAAPGAFDFRDEPLDHELQNAGSAGFVVYNECF